MDSVERESRCCLLECDGPGHLDGRAREEEGLVLMVVRSYSANIRAKELGAPAVTGFDRAAAAAEESFAAGLYVVSDKALKYVARLLASPPSLVIFEGIEHLWVPNCPDLEAGTVWMTKFSAGRVGHRGWASDCYGEALRNDAVVRRRSRRHARPAQVTRELYFDACSDENAPVLGALERGDAELAIRSFPGRFESRFDGGPNDRTGVCPICYEEPSPRITTGCCRRDLCLSCAAKSLGTTESCPWCRRETGLWDCSIEPGHSPAPFKDALLVDLVRACLDEGPDTRVLIVTTDDVYTYNVRTNPLIVFETCGIGGSAASVEAAVGSLEAGRVRVAVARADKMLCCGMVFPRITHVVFTERASFSGDRLRSWMAACPAAAAARAMVSIVEANGALRAPLTRNQNLCV